jgi:hypothetical protein
VPRRRSPRSWIRRASPTGNAERTARQEGERFVSAVAL